MGSKGEFSNCEYGGTRRFAAGVFVVIPQSVLALMGFWRIKAIGNVSARAAPGPRKKATRLQPLPFSKKNVVVAAVGR